MAQRGRKHKIDLNVQLEEYRKKCKDLLDADNCILPATATVYNELSSILEMSVKAIHWAVTRNADTIFAENVVKIKIKNEISNDALSDEDCSSYDPDGSTTVINIDEKYSEIFRIVVVKGPNRNHNIVKPGWSDALHDIIVSQMKLECIFNFKHANVVGGQEFTANSICGECGATIIATTQQNRSKLLVEFVKGKGTHTFEKLRRLTMTRSKSLLPRLKSDTVHNVHTEMVNEFGDRNFLPRNYVPEKSLSNSKHRHINKSN